MDTRAHWDAIYREKGAEGVSWYQAEARLSLELIIRVAPPDGRILDVGGGASRLVDGLLAAGYFNITVLDFSPAALEQARARLGVNGTTVSWIEADILTVSLPHHAMDVWHDRAVFHFLTAARDRERYVKQVGDALSPGGHVLVATFAEDGPTRCSGLEVVRYSPQALLHEFGADFQMVSSAREEHVTPAGVSQAFTYCLCRYMPTAAGPKQ
jgi:SAM-dependent methyltransferase